MRDQIEIIQGPSPLEIYHLGPPKSIGPLPSVFYFALDGPDSLLLDPYNQFIQFLFGTDIRCFSMTLPGHGPGFKKEEALNFVSAEFKAGKDPIKPFIDHAFTNVDYLVEENWIDPEKIAVSGLSRGGLFAAHLALQDTRIKTILAFAPITNLSFLIPEAKAYDLSLHTARFTDKILRFYIGNRDQRVSTDLCFSFIRQVADAAFEKGIRAPRCELIITPSIGYMGHGTAPSTFKNGADWIKELFS